MNVFLIITLVLSGLIDLVVGLWALLVPAGFAHRWLGVTQLSDPLQILIFVIGLAAIGLAALHIMAIRWLQLEKPEGFHLSIALGAAIAVVGIATYFFAQMRTPGIQNTIYLLAIDGLRGVILGVAGVVAMNAPATVTELRLPDRRRRAPARRRRESSRDGRERRSRQRDEDRSPRRTGERRQRATARDGESRPSRTRRDAARTRGGSADRDRSGRRRGRQQSARREVTADAPDAANPLRRRRLSSRNGASEERERRPQRRSGSASAQEIEDARSLGVVVTGRRPGRPTSEPSDGERSSRSKTGEGKEDKPQRPLAPMVPSLSLENGKSRRSERSSSEEGERRPRGRRQRRRPSSRETADRGSVVAASTGSVTDTDESRRDPGFDSPEPSGNRFVEKVERPTDRPDRSEDRRHDEPPQPEQIEIPEPPPEMPSEEPIDRISVFDALDKGDETEEQSEDEGAAYGRHRRPFSRQRKGRLVRPREQKVRQSLGGDPPRENDEPPPIPSENRRTSLDDEVGEEERIGPVDVDDTDHVDED